MKGANSASGRVAVEAHRDGEFNWSLTRVYLDFFKDEKSRPLFIQILPVEQNEKPHMMMKED